MEKGWPMRDLNLLIRPRFLGFRNQLFLSGGRPGKKIFFMGGLGVVFCAFMFILCARVLIYFQSVDVIGEFLARYLFSMVLLTFFSQYLELESKPRWHA